MASKSILLLNTPFADIQHTVHEPPDVIFIIWIVDISIEILFLVILLLLEQSVYIIINEDFNSIVLSVKILTYMCIYTGKNVLHIIYGECV